MSVGIIHTWDTQWWRKGWAQRRLSSTDQVLKKEISHWAPNVLYHADAEDTETKAHSISSSRVTKETEEGKGNDLEKER